MYEVGRRRCSKKGAVMELPEDIILTQILFRLPVKSLLKFKTVSKSWYSIINSTKFVKKQLNHAQSMLYDQHKNVLGLLIPSRDGSINRCILYNQNSDGIMYAKEFGFPIPFKLVDVCNICDGLICFINLSNHDILVWNPSLPMEYNIIPSEYDSKCDKFVFGMGYDSTTDDYKIVQVPKDRWNTSRDSFVKVFSLRNKSWSEKKISKNFTYVIRQTKSFYTRNRLHWCAKYRDGCGKCIQSIVYFDMVEERLDVMNKPCKSEGQIFNFKDSLAVIDHCGSLWVLEEYNGMKSSWSKFKLPKLKYCVDKKDTSAFSYSCFTRDGKILIEPAYVVGGCVSGGYGLQTYDLKDGYVRNVEIQGDDGIMYQKEYSKRGTFYASTFVESLILPK